LTSGQSTTQGNKQKTSLRGTGGAHLPGEKNTLAVIEGLRWEVSESLCPEDVLHMEGDSSIHLR